MPLTALPRSSIPSPPHTFLDEQIESAWELIASVPDWPLSRARDRNGVEGRSRPLQEGERAPTWHARVSVHEAEGEEGVGWEDFWRGLGERHTENEAMYIKDLRDFETVETLTPSARIMRIHYAFPFPFSPRDFTPLLLTSHLPPSDNLRAFLVVQVAVDHLAAPPRKGVVRGLYSSVERVREVRGEDGRVRCEWTMATISDAGGNVPGWVAEKTIPGEIAEDVPLFLNWVRKRKQDGAW